LIQVAELKNARARDQRLDDFKVGIFCGRTDERESPILDLRQERVLLGFVPAMDFVHEKDGAEVVQAAAFERLINDDAQISLACQDGGDGDEVTLGGVGDDLCEGGLARAWRAKQDNG
jgi:hypothetical protein